jgi:hypothetical protein
MPASEEDRDDLAAQGFLRLLVQLRTILLQDSVIMRKEFPNHPMWSDPLFVREDYQRFAAEVELSLSNIEEPEEIQIKKTVPAIANRLTVVQQSLTQTIKDFSGKTDQQMSDLSRQLNSILSGEVSFIVRAASASSVPVSSLPVSSDSAATVPAVSLSSYRINHTVLSEIPPAYEMSRTISTVPDLWREWTVGLGDNPAVQTLEDTYGPAWRPTQRERVMFGRRKVIIDEIRARQAKGVSIPAAVEEVELIRERSKKSLHGLSKMLKKRNCVV